MQGVGAEVWVYVQGSGAFARVWVQGLVWHCAFVRMPLTGARVRVCAWCAGTLE